MRKITLQSIFNKAWKHFIAGNGKPAANEHGHCAYCLPNGRKCAIGLSSPVTMNNPDAPAENVVFSSIVNNMPSLFAKNLYLQGDLDFFQASLHDNLQRKGRWEAPKRDRRAAYIAVAKEYGLKVPK